MVPGLTRPTHKSTLPLPLPIRVSEGLVVTGILGKTRIQSFPTFLIRGLISRRAASN